MTHLNVILASTLLEIEQDQKSNEAIFTTGVKKVDEQISLWKGGRVIGLGVVRGDEGEMARDNTSIDTSLLLRLITTHLIDNSKSQSYIPSPSPHQNTNNSLTLPSDDQPHHQHQHQHQSLYIITPPNTTTISEAYNMFRTQLQSQSPSIHTPSPPPTPNQIEQITSSTFERVSILPYLDLTGLAESISEISSSLSLSSLSLPPSNPHPKTTNKKPLIIIQGLTQTLSTALSRSSTSVQGNLVRTAALLSHILRDLRGLVRRTGVLVLVEFEVVLEIPRTGAGGGGKGGGFDSGFADSGGRKLRIEIGDDGRGAGVVLERMLENAMDGIVVCHDGFKGKEEMMVVEIVKDGLGDELGNWAVWDGR